MPGRLVGRQLGARKISTKALQGPVPWHHRMGAADVSQLWNRRPVKPTRLYSQARMVFRAPRRPFHSSKARKSAAEGAKKEPESLSLSGRLKKLSREYGWAAVGIYLGLSVLDFPFCFLLVRTLGTERIGKGIAYPEATPIDFANESTPSFPIAVAEEFVISNVQKAIPERAKTAWHDYRKSLKEAESEVVGNEDISKGLEAAGWGVKEADERNKSEPSES